MGHRFARIPIGHVADKLRRSAWIVATAASCSTARPSEQAHDLDSVTTQQSLTASPPVNALTVSFMGPVDSLIASTGNLYWTSRYAGSGSRVWRAGKSNVPGQEIPLYTEQDTAASIVFFSNFVYAHTSDFFGYFVALYPSNGQSLSLIKRVPLTGGQAVTLATVPSGFASDLATDQATTLFWTDAGGVRKMAIDGGPVTTLFTGTARYLGIDASNVYFGAGTSIRRVPIAGGPDVQVVSVLGGVEALYVDATHGRIIYGEGGRTGGSVRSVPLAGGSISTYQESSAAQIFGVGSDGTRVFWTECFFRLDFDPGCELRQFDPISGRVSYTSTDIDDKPGNNRDFRDVQWDASGVYFATSTGVKRTCVGANFGLASCGCDPQATTCSQVVCGTTTNNCFQSVNCPSNCVPPATCSNITPNTCCVSNGDPCGDQCGGTATDNCGNVFNCHASCGLDGQCPCQGGRCDPTSNFCACYDGPCF